MRYVGLVCIGAGIAILVFFGYLYMQEQNRMRSPIPETTGVKVIQLSPSLPKK